tara:strand:- start:101 stop:1912 length:1812 start_codon:yes stop_codon:yes gene_type:complete
MNLNNLSSLINRGANFVSKLNSRDFRSRLEESTEVFDAIDYLSNKLDDLFQIKFIVLTNKELRIRGEKISMPLINNIKTVVSIFDIEKIKKLEEGLNINEEMEIDLSEEYKESIPVLSAHMSESPYRSYLAVMSGQLLASIYERWGNRLLEKNVRVFLQAKGSVNKGIRNTIDDDPSMFFAYNNGITATADDIKVEDLPRGRAITQIKNLQIVNGGQTTASIYSAYKNKKDVSKVFVQMKLSVVNKEKSEEVVPLISRYANSQNKINAADFSSNHPFHLQIEKLSRGILAPPAENSIKSTKWFYERSRGQYQDMKNKGFTVSQKKRFESENPTRQKLTKTDMAKFLNIWKYKPALVCKGVQKNFVEFSEGIDDEWKKNSSKYDETFYKELVAKAIIFKTLDKLVLSKKDSWYRGYKSAIVPYTLSILAWEIKKYKKHFNFSKVWTEQSISDDLKAELIRVAEDVNKILNNPPVNMPGNILEFAKREGCWEIIKSNKYQWSKKLDQYLISEEEFKKKKKDLKFKPILQKKLDVELLIGSSQSAFWQKLETWINSRSDFELTDSETILMRKALGMQKTFVPNFGQATRLHIIYQRATNSGFNERL